MNHPKRLDRCAYRGSHRHFLTICAHQRRPVFTEPGIVAEMTRQIFRTAQAWEFEITAYCFMPDHWHAVVAGSSPGSDLERFVRFAKQGSSYAFLRAGRGRLWQASYWDRTLRADQSTAEVIRYLLANPVRAGLVARIDAYPYWGSQACTREELLEFVGASASRRT